MSFLTLTFGNLITIEFCNFAINLVFSFPAAVHLTMATLEVPPTLPMAPLLPLPLTRMDMDPLQGVATVTLPTHHAPTVEVVGVTMAGVAMVEVAMVHHHVEEEVVTMDDINPRLHHLTLITILLNFFVMMTLLSCTIIMPCIITPVQFFSCFN